MIAWSDLSHNSWGGDGCLWNSGGISAPLPISRVCSLNVVSSSHLLIPLLCVHVGEIGYFLLPYFSILQKPQKGKTTNYELRNCILILCAWHKIIPGATVCFLRRIFLSFWKGVWIVFTLGGKRPLRPVIISVLQGSEYSMFKSISRTVINSVICSTPFCLL
jgi:hypothetical protein